MFGNDRDRKHSEYEFVWERPGSKTFGVRISNGIDLNKKLSEVRERKGAIGGDWEQPESNTKSGFERKSIFFGVESNSSFRAGAAHGKLPAPTPGRATPPPPYLRGKHFATWWPMAWRAGSPRGFEMGARVYIHMLQG